MITVNELFSGIGAFRKALERLNIPHKIIGISEIDEHAINSYEAIFGATRNYGDISRVNKLDYADMWTYGFPCQDISICGQQAGIIKGETRSGLLYEVQRLLVSAALLDELPRYLILENVKNLVGKKFKNDFHSWLEWLSAMGYHNYWQVINAKDCGIPQNRERVFVVSIRKDIDEGFSFPEKIPLTITMHDLSETEVEEKFYPPPTIFDSSEFDEALMVSDAKASLAKCIGGIGEKKSNGGKQYYQQDRVYAGDIALAHPAQITGGSYYYAIKEPRDKNAPWISSKGVKYILSPKRGMCTDVLEFTYSDEDSIATKIEKVAKNIYGAASVTFAKPAMDRIKLAEKLGMSSFPVCIAKTQFSFSADAKLYGAVKGFNLQIRDVVLNAGAEMIVAIAGDIIRMPGLPKDPQANHIDYVNGEIVGLS